MIVSLHCHRCGAYGQAEGADVFDAEHQAEAAGWVTHAIVHTDGIYDVVDVCPSCRMGAAPSRSAGAGLAPSRPCAAPRCMHAAGPAETCRCAVCGGLAHGIAPWPADQQLSLFDEAAPLAGAASESHEATPASPGERTTSTRLDGYYPIRPGNGVTAGETALLDNMGAAARRDDAHPVSSGNGRGNRGQRLTSNCSNSLDSSTEVVDEYRVAAGAGPASALSSVSPAQGRLHAPDPADGPSGDRCTVTPQHANPTNTQRRMAPAAPALDGECS